LVGQIQDCDLGIVGAVLGILALGGWVGALENYWAEFSAVSSKANGSWWLTEVLRAFCDHLAIDLPQPVAGIDDLGGVGRELVAADDVLYGKRLAAGSSEEFGCSRVARRARHSYPVNDHFDCA
jgi:hypothetical protein